MKKNIPCKFDCARLNRLKLLILTFSFCGFSASAAEWPVSNRISWILDGNTMIISGSGALTNRSGTDWPWNGDSLVKYVRIAEGITAIGSGAFNNCSCKWIEIPTSVKKIEKNAFRSMDALKNGGIRMLGTIPPIVDSRAFDFDAKTMNNISLIFPIDAIDIYLSSEFWSNFKIKAATDISEIKVDFVGGSTRNYTGAPIRPQFTVSEGSKQLVRNEDYTDSTQNNINAGLASIVLTGQYAYTGTTIVEFTINRATPEIIWPKVNLKAGEMLSDATLKGGSAFSSTEPRTEIKGSFTFKTPYVQPLLSDNESTLFTMVFTPNNKNYMSVEKDVTVHVTLGVTGDRSPDNINVYPNPYRDEVHVIGASGSTLYIMNVAGVNVHTQQMSSPDEVVSLSHVREGMYFFRFVFPNGRTKTVKVLGKH